MSHEDDVSFLDKTEILQIIFPVVYSPFYFQMAGRSSLPDTAIRFIEVEKGIKIGCGFWAKSKECPTILYFHGNGETVVDYDWLAQLYIKRGVNLFVADYRGYGVSTGKPTVTNLLRDCHAIFQGFKKFLKEEGHRADYFIMGRSLGSIPAVELAYHYQDQFRGLIIESGSANNFHRLWTYLEASERETQLGGKFLNKEKMRSILIPTCIIHGEYDEIIPVQEGLELYQKSGAANKDILVISGAGHNDLMMTGHDQYFEKIEGFVKNNLE
jgi:alpha-beta hydrolase superfamily lysophospholipase